MRPRPWLKPRALHLLLPALAALLVTGSTAAADKVWLDPSLCAPGRHEFTLAIDNAYFPLPVGQRWVFTGEEDGESVGLRITVLDETEPFYSDNKRLTTRVVEELEWADANGNGRVGPREDLIEVSRNYFAQTEDGTVCYFGEVVDIYEGGVVVSHEGSWRADDRRNAPGIYMPAEPKPGMRFQQERAPGVAEDFAIIVAIGERAKVPAGTFRETLRVRDRNPLDGSSGTKVYAPGVGLIVDGPLELVRY